MYSYTNYFISRSRVGCPVSASSYDHVIGTRRASSEERYQRAVRSSRSHSVSPACRAESACSEFVSPVCRAERACSELADNIIRRERARSLSRAINEESSERMARASSVESSTSSYKSEEKTVVSKKASDDYLSYLRTGYLSPYNYLYRAPFYQRTYYTFYPDCTYSIYRTPRMFSSSRYNDFHSTHPYGYWRTGSYSYPSYLSDTYPLRSTA